MVEKGFKIGDKVKLKNPASFSCGDKVLTIIKEAGKDNNKFIYVTYEGESCKYFPLYPDEVELAVKVGEQLTFAFMSEITK